MALPDLIEIQPLLSRPIARIVVPGSKSVTNRAFILAALAEGRSTLRGALWSEDTEVMTAALSRLGFELQVETDPVEAGNRMVKVDGLGGVVPASGTAGAPLELFVANAGTAARFLAALVCLGRGSYRLSGVPRMGERPQASLFDALRELGYQVDSPNGRLPAVIHGQGPRAGVCQVSVAESSQFASALILSAIRGGWRVDVIGHNEEESPYVEMTKAMVKAFPKTGGDFAVEPDASSGSYFVAADWLLGRSSTGGSGIQLPNWPTSGWQIDQRFPEALRCLESGEGVGEISRASDLGDSIMTAIVLAPFAQRPMRFTDLGRLRVQECERVAALRMELVRCGACVVEQGDSLQVTPGPLHGAEIETYNDHRVAMCFAVLGLSVKGIKLRNPACVKKTFPNFFQKLSAPPPGGLGATILDGRTGRKLALPELFAE